VIYKSILAFISTCKRVLYISTKWPNILSQNGLYILTKEPFYFVVYKSPVVLPIGEKGNTATRCNTLQYAATHCNILRLTATCCNTLQHTATHCNTHGVAYAAGCCPDLEKVTHSCVNESYICLTWLIHMRDITDAYVCHGLFTGVACDPVYCSDLQHTATHCNTLQHTATH